MAKPVTQVCLLGATFNTGNMGVSVLTAGAIRCILHRFPEAQITLLDYAQQGSKFTVSCAGQRVPIELVNIRFSKKLYLANNIAVLIFLSLAAKLIPFRGMRERLLSRNTWLKKILAADLVLSVAGGDSFSDIYGLSRLFYVTLPQLLVLFLGKRMLLLPQTIGPFNRPIAKRIAAYILTHAELIYSRDNAGLTTAQGLLGSPGNASKIRFCYDMGFVVDPLEPKSLDGAGAVARSAKRSTVVGFNVSGLLAMGGYSQDNMFGLQTSYEGLVSALIELFIKEKNATVLLIPHVLGPLGDTESDTPVCKRLYESGKALYQDKIAFAGDAYSYDEVKYIIGQCDFFVGSRMHACIAAISQSVPAVSIAYSDKFIGVMETVDSAALVVDPRKMRQDEIVKVIEQAYERRVTVRGELSEIMPRVKQTVQNLLDCVETV